jgi:hypothetical protein
MDFGSLTIISQPFTEFFQLPIHVLNFAFKLSTVNCNIDHKSNQISRFVSEDSTWAVGC